MLWNELPVGTIVGVAELSRNAVRQVNLFGIVKHFTKDTAVVMWADPLWGETAHYDVTASVPGYIGFVKLPESHAVP